MNMRTKYSPAERSRRALSQALGIAALSILAATSPVGASGGNIDNDSPYNLPNATDGGGNGNGGGSGGESGGGLKSLTPAPVDPRGRFAGMKWIVPQVGIGSTFSVVESLATGAYVSIPASKIAVGTVAPNPNAPVVRLEMTAGDDATAVDSKPTNGDLSVELQGEFTVTGAAQVLLHPTQSFVSTTGMIVIGEKSATVPENFARIDHVLPLGAIASGLDVAALAKTFAGVPTLVGLDVAVVVGHKTLLVGGGAGFHVSATAEFEVSARPQIRIDTAPNDND
jgi:hypothetical protein